MEVALVYFAVIALAFFVLIVRPQRRRLAAHRAFVTRLSVGDDVVTTGGIFGTVRGLEDDRVDLEISPGVVIAVARAAVAQSANAAIPPAAPGSSAEDGPAEDRPAGDQATDD
ncbi:MAG: preprotein translocase subunit YajC [Acidimicrobiia bacterium]